MTRAKQTREATIGEYWERLDFSGVTTYLMAGLNRVHAYQATEMNGVLIIVTDCTGKEVEVATIACTQGDTALAGKEEFEIFFEDAPNLRDEVFKEASGGARC